MPAFTLDEIRESADKKYGSTDIELDDGQVVELVNPLRLRKDKRKKLMNIQKELDDGDADQEDVLADAIRLVAKNKAPADKLLEEIGEDLTVLVGIFERYTEGSEVGEASASES